MNAEDYDPKADIEKILRHDAAGILTETETFWRIVSWAGGEAVTDDHLDLLPEYWRTKVVEGLSAIRTAHPILLRGTNSGEWTEEAMKLARARRDRAVLRFAALL
jgi:hypothetical protein